MIDYSQVVFTSDQTPGAGKNGNGIVIINPNSIPPKSVLPDVTGSAFMMLLTADQANTVANMSIGKNFPGTYIYTAVWSEGSTYSTTPVWCGFINNFFNTQPIWAFVLDPTDSTYKTFATGTYNFPVTIIASPDTNYPYSL